MKWKFGVASIALSMLASVTAASANVTKIEDIYTLTGGVMGGTFSGATASGNFGVDYYSNGKDYLFANVTVKENVSGTGYTYNFNYNCYSLTPGCNSQFEAPSEYPGASGFNAVLTIDTYAYTGNPSIVPLSFSDFVFELERQRDIELRRQPRQRDAFAGGAAALRFGSRRGRSAVLASETEQCPHGAGSLIGITRAIWKGRLLAAFRFEAMSPRPAGD